MYKERNEDKRHEFEQTLATLTLENLVYVDECGLDETLEREYGWQTIGQRVLGEVQGKKPNRTSIIAGLNQGNPIAPFYFEGYCNTEVVLTWITEVLVPELKPGQIIVWDNASFHQSKELENAIHQAGCHLLFLPPYSPDLNPIEHFEDHPQLLQSIVGYAWIIDALNS